MKKKILTAVLTLVMCFTILISVAGCKASSTETLTVTYADGAFSNITAVSANNDNAMRAARLACLRKISKIVYDDGYLDDTDPENDQYHIKKEWPKEGNSTDKAYDLFLADGGLVSGFTIDSPGTRTAVFTYRGGSFSITYTVKAAA